MRIGLLHGWLLDGSGSNIYVRCLAEALAGRGHEVHVFCQEPRPERFGALPKGLHIHRPPIDRSFMPVYVADTDYEGFAAARPFHELAGTPLLERYLAEFTAGVLRGCRDHRIEVLHANHVYPMPEVARRVKGETGIPFLVFPHGSAIEYAVKRSLAVRKAAGTAIDAADRLVVGNRTVTERLYRLYPDRAGAWGEKHSLVPVGVDPKLFEPVPRPKRFKSIESLLRGPLESGGRDPEAVRGLREGDYPSDDSLLRAVSEADAAYEHKAPDLDLAEKLRAVPWERGRILVFAGKLITGKGLHDFLMAFPSVLERHPDAVFLIVGEGPFRQALELLLRSLSEGDRALFDRIVRLGGALEGGPPSPLRDVSRYLARSGEERVLGLGKRTRPIERVVFTGYLRHGLYRHLLPCADVAVFPSSVAEAYPLVLLEAASAGVLPAGSGFEGLGEGLKEIGARLGGGLSERMRFSMEPDRRIQSMADCVNSLLDGKRDRRKTLRKLVLDRYSWSSVAERMENEYRRMSA